MGYDIPFFSLIQISSFGVRTVVVFVGVAVGEEQSEEVEGYELVKSAVVQVVAPLG